jgi:hypothetical protein
MALSIAGTVTKNKTLKTVGMVMGIAGGVVGIGASLAGVGGMTLGEVGTSVGDFFSGAAMSGTEAAASTAASSAVDAGAQAAEGASGTFTQAAGAQPGIGEFPSTAIDPNGPVANLQAQYGGFDVTPVAAQGQPASSLAGTSPTLGATPTSEGDLSALTLKASAGPGAPTVNPDGSLTTLGPSTQANQLATQYGDKLPPFEPGNAKGWFDKLSPAMQASLALAGGQAISGAVGGLFQGMAASDQLELQKLINEQNRSQQAITNARGAYSPRISFNSPSGPAGTLSMAGRK